jgi:hypothetical protein
MRTVNSCFSMQEKAAVSWEHGYERVSIEPEALCIESPIEGAKLPTAGVEQQNAGVEFLAQFLYGKHKFRF